jgi:outer membrane protein TolC
MIYRNIAFNLRKTSFRKKIFFIILFFIPPILNAQEVSLNQCREMALQNNKRIAISDKNKEKAALTVKAYRTNYMPKLSASGVGYFSNSSNNINIKTGDISLFDPYSLASLIPTDYLPYLILLSNYTTITIPDMKFNLKINNIYIAGANIDQPVYMGGKINAAYKMSKIGNDIAGLTQELTRDEIILETDKAYWTTIQAQELYKSAKKFKETVEEFYRVVKNACDAGLKPKNDLMKLQVQLNKADLALQRAENGVNLSRMNLCQIIGLPLQAEIILYEAFTEQLQMLSFDGDIFSRPEYTMLNKQIELKEQEKRVIKSDFMPKAGIRGSYNYINGILLNNEKLFHSGSFSAMASLTIPLFQWGEGVQKIKAAEAEKDIVRLQRDYLSEKMELERMQILNRYNEALLELELTHKAVEQSKENLKMSKDHYEVGMETISDYLEAQTILQNAQTEYIIAKTKIEICKTEYLKVTGEL